MLLAPVHQIPRRMPPMRHERPPVARLGWQTRVVGSAIAILPLIFLLGCQALSQKQGAANPPPGQLTSNASTFAFGTVPVGANQSGSVVVTNAGGSPVTISQAKLSTAGFSLAGLNLPVVLNASQSTKFNLNFSPRSPGSISGNLSLVSDATNPNLDTIFVENGVTIQIDKKGLEADPDDWRINVRYDATPQPDVMIAADLQSVAVRGQDGRLAIVRTSSERADE